MRSVSSPRTVDIAASLRNVLGSDSVAIICCSSRVNNSIPDTSATSRCSYPIERRRAPDGLSSIVNYTIKSRIFTFYPLCQADGGIQITKIDPIDYIPPVRPETTTSRQHDLKLTVQTRLVVIEFRQRGETLGTVHREPGSCQDSGATLQKALATFEPDLDTCTGDQEDFARQIGPCHPLGPVQGRARRTQLVVEVMQVHEPSLADVAAYGRLKANRLMSSVTNRDGETTDALLRQQWFRHRRFQPKHYY